MTRRRLALVLRYAGYTPMQLVAKRLGLTSADWPWTRHEWESGYR